SATRFQNSLGGFARSLPSVHFAPERSLREFQPLFPIKFPERLDDFAEITRDDGVQLVQRQIDAMISHPVLREGVGADALGAVAGADERASLLGPLAVERFLLALVDAAPQDAHGPLEILVLAALVLALDFHLLRRAALVPDAHGRLGLV